ncbi:unnamed protein product [Ilex paraguariensis]|uniref:HMA domain-containing protein n=1 Tax=Ilex paraguariensis TaxID=185542 RepID=A0ABC8SRL9_9AQUA
MGILGFADMKNDKKKKNGDGGGERKTKKDAIDKPKEKLEQKKSNELVQPQLATAMLKVHSHCDCDGCTENIQKVVTKTIDRDGVFTAFTAIGYHQMAIDGANGQVTVKGSMDMNALAKSLEQKLKRYVEIVPLSPQKEDEKKEKIGCDHKEKDGGERNIGGEGDLDGENTEKRYGDEFAKYVNGDTKKPTVIGKVNPAELRPTVDQKKGKNNNKGDEGENEVKQRITVIRTETKKAIRGFPRVESVIHDEGNTNKQTVIREEHPSRFGEAVENVQQASPLPTKDKKNDKKKNGDDGCGGEERKTKKAAIDKPKEKLEQKKSNELVQPQLATAMLKVHSHCDCDGCTDNIRKVVTKTIGNHQMAIDGANGQVTVKGSMDVNALAKSLERKLKRYVEIVPLSPQKEDEKKDKSGCDHKE